MATHWKKLHNPDYLGSYALEPGQDLVLTIKFVQNETIVGPDGKKEECTVAHFVEKSKPMILNATNCKAIQKLYRTPYIEDWGGRKIQIFSDNVKAFGEVVEALRIRPFIPKVDVEKEDLICTDCKKTITEFGGKSAAYIAQYTYKKYGKKLCAACGEKQKNEMPEDVLNGTEQQ